MSELIRQNLLHEMTVRKKERNMNIFQWKTIVRRYSRLGKELTRLLYWKSIFKVFLWIRTANSTVFWDECKNKHNAANSLLH